MAHRGQTLTDSFFGGRVTFETTAADSGGRLLVTVSELAARFPAPPLHVHPHQTERFEVLRGRLRVERAAEHHVLEAGDTLEVAPGVAHTFAPADAEDAVRLRVSFSPAGDVEGFLEGVAQLAAGDGLDGRPHPLRLAPLALAHRDDVRLARVPAVAQRAVLEVLARIARVTGAGPGKTPAMALPPVVSRDPVTAQGARLVALADLPPSRVTEVRTDAHGTLAVGLAGDAPFAVSNVCRHQFAKLGRGEVHDGCLQCPWHRARFDVRTGRMVRGPQGRVWGIGPYSAAVKGFASSAWNLKVHPVEVRDGAIWLTGT